MNSLLLVQSLWVDQKGRLGVAFPIGSFQNCAEHPDLKQKTSRVAFKMKSRVTQPDAKHVSLAQANETFHLHKKINLFPIPNDHEVERQLGC